MHQRQQLSAESDRLVLTELYEAFNARDVESILAAMAEEVEWPNAWEGGQLRGKAAIRAYWLRQWREIDPHVEPVAITTRADGTVAVDVEQVVRQLDGTIVSESRVVHVYAFRDGLIASMHVG